MVWNTKGIKGDRTVAVTADPANAIAESDEANNTASRTVTVKGNRVQNGDFQSSTNGAPDSWSSSGSTSYDGNSAKAGPGGSWTSAPIAVEPGRTYGLAVDAAGRRRGRAAALRSRLIVTSTPLAAALVPAAGVTQVRIRLEGVTGATFDNVWLWEQLQ